ncbi:MAG: phosphatidylglycerophosphatase A [Holosporales bacterium]|jgi:phosphatidylglycerophosphatase A|nr:phosphatidylglycerophosphatase A [Holosporales bacterium]
MELFGKINSKNVLLLLISVCGIGLISKKIPGTVASVFSTLFAILFIGHSKLLLVLLTLLFIAGMAMCHYFIVIKKFDTNKDPKYIVIDEVCGILFGAYLLNLFNCASILALIANFAIFRFFDILKPFPIKNIENLMKQNSNTIAFGIMFDDILASVFATALQISILKMLSL